MVSPLSEHQTRELKNCLKERFNQLREETRQELLKSDNEQYIELAGKVHDLEDEAIADLLVDLNLAGISRRIREIRDIDAALLRLAQGTYGVCIECDDPIDFERLQAYPTAPRCHRCQAFYEKTHVQEGHPSL